MAGCCLALWAGRAHEWLGSGERVWAHCDTCKWQVGVANHRPMVTRQEPQRGGAEIKFALLQGHQVYRPWVRLGGVRSERAASFCLLWTEVIHLPKDKKGGKRHLQAGPVDRGRAQDEDKGQQPQEAAGHRALWRWRRRSSGAGQAWGQIPLCHFLAAGLRARLLSPLSSVSLSAEWETTSGRLLLTGERG